MPVTASAATGTLTEALASRSTPLRVGLIGAGKFGTMFPSQARRLEGLHLLGIADLMPERARANLAQVDWPIEQYGAASPAEARDRGTTFVTDDAAALIATDGLDLIVEATGNPLVGVRHALQAFDHGLHVVNVNVEADVLAGPALAARAAAVDRVYTLAYGDQPALICELVEWARVSGFEVVSAGKGTKYLPIYHTSTPETVWDHYGIDAETAARDGMNPQMFNSFLDGTKSAIEMAAVANATGLTPQSAGLGFPPCGTDDLQRQLIPRADGGVLEHAGTVEVISCLERDGSPVPRDLRWGVYVVVAAPNEYVSRCFASYGMPSDPSGRYAAMYRPYHLVGLELAVSVLKAGLRSEATGVATGFHGDVVAAAKRDLKPNEVLDGEGGSTVHGLLRPAAAARTAGALPMGLAHGLALARPVAADCVLCYDDVQLDESDPALALRRQMEPA